MLRTPQETEKGYELIRTIVRFDNFAAGGGWGEIIRERFCLLLMIVMVIVMVIVLVFVVGKTEGGKGEGRRG